MISSLFFAICSLSSRLSISCWLKCCVPQLIRKEIYLLRLTRPGHEFVVPSWCTLLCVSLCQLNFLVFTGRSSLFFVSWDMGQQWFQIRFKETATAGKSFEKKMFFRFKRQKGNADNDEKKRKHQTHSFEKLPNQVKKENISQNINLL